MVKKYFKMFRWAKGTKMFKNSASAATYKTVWCAGPSLENWKKSGSFKVISELTDNFSMT